MEALRAHKKGFAWTENLASLGVCGLELSDTVGASCWGGVVTAGVCMPGGLSGRSWAKFVVLETLFHVASLGS